MKLYDVLLYLTLIEIILIILFNGSEGSIFQ